MELIRKISPLISEWNETVQSIQSAEDEQKQIFSEKTRQEIKTFLESLRSVQSLECDVAEERAACSVKNENKQEESDEPHTVPRHSPASTDEKKEENKEECKK